MGILEDPGAAAQKKRAAVYVRVSTAEQNYENQRPAIDNYIAAMGFEVVAEYAEEASAWKKGHQKEFKRLMADARAGSFDVLVVWALDRLTREGALKALLIFDKLIKSNILLYSTQEPWLAQLYEMGILEFVIPLLAWAARQESQTRSERTKAGIARRRAGGGIVGRPPGSKDKKRRKKDGYKDRQARERIARLEATTNDEY